MLVLTAAGWAKQAIQTPLGLRPLLLLQVPAVQRGRKEGCQPLSVETWPEPTYGALQPGQGLKPGQGREHAPAWVRQDLRLTGMPGAAAGWQAALEEVAGLAGG